MTDNVSWASLSLAIVLLGWLAVALPVGTIVGHQESLSVPAATSADGSPRKVELR